MKLFAQKRIAVNAKAMTLVLGLCRSASAAGVVRDCPSPDLWYAPMKDQMGTPRRNLQVFEGIVRPVAVDMMHNFVGAKWPAKPFFNHKTMLENVAVFIRIWMVWAHHEPIPARGHRCAAAPTRTICANTDRTGTLTGTKVPTTFGDVLIPGKKFPATVQTGSRNGRLLGHRSYSFGVVLRAVPTAPGLSYVSRYCTT
jgi:hypothetical protein